MVKDRAGFAQVSSFVTQRPSRQASSSNRKSRRILVKEDVTSKSHSDLDNGEDGDDDGCYHLLIYRAPAISQGPNGHRPVSRRVTVRSSHVPETPLWSSQIQCVAGGQRATLPWLSRQAPPGEGELPYPCKPDPGVGRRPLPHSTCHLMEHLGFSIRSDGKRFLNSWSLLHTDLLERTSNRPECTSNRPEPTLSRTVGPGVLVHPSQTSRQTVRGLAGVVGRDEIPEKVATAAIS